MGCGASKSAGVVDSDITIKNHPGRPHHGTGVSSPAALVSSGGSMEGVTPQLSNQSGIERTVQEIIARSPGSPQAPSHFSPSPHGHPLPSPPMGSTATDRRTHEQALLPNSTPSNDSLPQPVAFEVCMSLDGDTAPKAPPPRRLVKLDSAPKLTKEMLKEKQRVVEGRKMKELEKRAHTRLSKRERLRREIMQAREMDFPAPQHHGKEAGHKLSLGQIRLQEEAVDHHLRGHKLGSREEDGGSFTASAEIEVDSTFNAEQNAGFWDNNQGSENNVSSSLQRSHKPATLPVDDDFFSGLGAKTNLLENSSENMEQYM